MRVPVWLTLGVAVLVIVFGSFRIRLALKKAAPDDGGARLMGGGFYKMSSRTHLLIGVVYLLLGGALIATSFGWHPFGDVFGPDTQAPSKDKAPTKSGIPVDQLPAKKGS